MALNYAAALSKYPDKGVLGAEEIVEDLYKIEEKASILANEIKSAKRIVFITGAGISTSCGIPDFRGPKGVWTLEEIGCKPTINIDFKIAAPSYTHFAICALLKSQCFCYVISQNVDNLHMRSGIPKFQLSEVHGNIFTEKCMSCGREFMKGSPTETIGLKKTGKLCSSVRSTKRKCMCRGKLVDSVLDWEDSLPWDELAECEYQCSVADLCIVLGTSLQIQPTGNLPFRTKRNGGKIVIINLQKTRMDYHADLVIHAKCDDVMRIVTEKLEVDVEENVIDLPEDDQLVVIKHAYRPDPPSFRAKRLKKEKQEVVPEHPLDLPSENKQDVPDERDEVKTVKSE